jgi:hypothetical protein
VATKDAVDGLRGAYREALQTAREPRRRVRLHEQVQMIGLHRKMNQAERLTRCLHEGALERFGQIRLAE